MKHLCYIWVVLLLVICNAAAQQPISVRVDQLIKFPQRFNDKLVSITGYYDVEHHGAYLCVDKKSGERSESRVHLDFDHSPISVESVSRVPHGYVVATGIFQYRDMTTRIASDGSRVIPAGFGWMNTANKQLTRITAFRRLAGQKP